MLQQLLTSSSKVIFLDAFMSDSALSVCCSFAKSVSDVRLIIGRFSTERGVLWTIPPALK